MDIQEVLERLSSGVAFSPQDQAFLLNELSQFQLQSDAWKTCCFRLRGLAKRDQPETIPLNMVFFFLNTIEKFIASPARWGVIQNDGKLLVRDVLIGYANGSFAAPLKRKACQVLVALGKRECCSTWPQFAEYVQSEAILNGRFDLLLATCELLASHFLTEGMGFSKIKADELRTYQREVAAPSFISALSQGRLLFNETSLLAGVALVEWIPLNLLTLEFVNDVLRATMENESVAVPAISCLSSILDRNFVPPESESFVQAVSDRAIELLNVASTKLGSNKGYSHVVLLFISAYIRRHLPHAQRLVSVNNFLQVFVSFTFNLNDFRQFCTALDVWSTLIGVCAELEGSTNQASPFEVSIVGTLVWNLLERFMFTKSQNDNSKLEMLCRLERSDDLMRGEDELDEENEPNQYGKNEENANGEDCDLTYLVVRIARLLQKAATLPHSALTILGPVLKTVFDGIEVLKNVFLGEVSSSLNFVTRDLNLLICAVANATPALLRPDYISEVGALGEICAGLLERCVFLRDHVLKQSKERVSVYALGAQCLSALTALSSLLPSTANGSSSLSKSLTLCTTLLCGAPSPQLATTLSSEEQVAKLNDSLQRASVRLLSVVSSRDSSVLEAFLGSSNSSTLLAATSFQLPYMSEKSLSVLYETFASHAKLEVVRTVLVGDVLAVLNGEDEVTVCRGLVGLSSIIRAAKYRPESSFRKMIFQTACAPVLSQAVRLLHSQPGNSSSYLKQPVDVSLAYIEACLVELRRVMGDKDCALLVETCVNRAQTLDDMRQVRVLGMVRSVLEETSTVLESLLPRSLELAIQICQNPTGSFDAEALGIFKAALVSHSQWFMTPANTEWLVNVLQQFVNKLTLSSSPDTARCAIIILLEVNQKHSLFHKQIFKQFAFPQVVLQCLGLILSAERDMLIEDINRILFGLAKVDLGLFHSCATQFYSNHLSETAMTLTRISKIFDPNSIKDQNAFEEAITMLVGYSH